MNRKRKQILLGMVFCLTTFLIGGCGEEKKGEDTIQQTQKTLTYEESDFAALPDQDIVTPEGVLEVSTLQRDREGRLAMYVPEQGMDDGDYYEQVTEYALNSDGSWERKNICEKSITKRVFKSKGSWIYSMPYIIRGDDGELYALLQMDWPDVEEDEDGTPSTQYSVLQLDEEQDQFYEIALRLDDRSLEGVDTSADVLSKFHVLEDGTLFFVFGNRTAIQFDADTGAPVAVCENIPDNAFAQNVCYGEKEFIFYSSSSKLLGVLDLETMTVARNFGEEIEESYRKREWLFDTHTDDWTMYGFNTSGLYSIRLTGKNASIQRISRDNSFDSLTDVTLYDALVDENQNVYVLIRKKAEDSYEYQNMWEFGVAKFSCTG